MFQIKTTEFDGIPVRLYYPAGRESITPALIYIHGGGFVTGSAGELIRNVSHVLILDVKFSVLSAVY